jgi:hypothetical protein
VPGTQPRPRRGTAVIAVIIVLIIIDLIVVGITLGLSRDHDLTIRRLETVKAAYAAEAGINMAIREMQEDEDQDGDGEIGTISYEQPVYDPNDDPALDIAFFYVTKSYDAGLEKTTISSYGRCGEAVRRMVSEIYDY